MDLPEGIYLIAMYGMEKLLFLANNPDL